MQKHLQWAKCNHLAYVLYICLTCYSQGDTAVRSEEDFDVIPEDTQPSAEEEEQLQKKTGEAELICPAFKPFCLKSEHVY